LTVASTTAPSTQTDDPIAHAVRSFSRPSNVAGYARILAAANNCRFDHCAGPDGYLTIVADWMG
jgi:hypothetical protein